MNDLLALAVAILWVAIIGSAFVLLINGIAWLFGKRLPQADDEGEDR